MKISIIIPVYNEEKYIERCLDSLLLNSIDPGKTEIMICDGMSTDKTRELLIPYIKKYSFIKIINNYKTKQVYGLNQCIKLSKNELIIRCDAHSVYPPDYISELVKWHKKNIADNIGGIWITLPADNSDKAHSIAAVLNSPLGVGFSYRTEKKKEEKYVDTVPFGSFKKDLFNKIGLFDEEFIRSQDLEFNIRIKKSSGRVLLLPWLVIKYYARPDWHKLWQMFFQYGFWKNKVNKKHKLLSSIRQLAPVFLITGFLTLLILTFLSKIFIILFIFYALLYILPILVISIIETIKCKKSILFIINMLVSFILVHTAYGLSYILGFIYFIILQKNTPGKNLTKNTR